MLSWVHRVMGRPWAVEVGLAERVREIVSQRWLFGLRELAQVRGAITRRYLRFESGPDEHAGEPLTPEAARSARLGSRSAGAVQVIPAVGLMSQRGGMTEDCALMVSTDDLAGEVLAAAANDAVAAIVLEFDSPGGEVYGVAEAASAIREARAQKPVVSVANSLAASAAYWLATQANEVFVTPSGEVGSVGVYALHQDFSKAAELKGVKYTYVSAGRYKVEGNPLEPLGDEARGEFQRQVDRYYGMFVADVAKGRTDGDRRVGVDQVRSGYGEGRVVGARQAVETGMADQVGTLDDAIRRAAALARDRSRGGGSRAELQVRMLRRGRS